MNQVSPADQGHEDAGKTSLQSRQLRALSALYQTMEKQHNVMDETLVQLRSWATELEPSVQKHQTLLDHLLVEQREQTERLAAIEKKLSATVSRQSASGLQPVKVEDINMPFSAMVGLILKVALASIPAAIFFYLIIAVLGLLFAGVLGVGLF